MMSPQQRRQSVMDFERFCQEQHYNVVREMNESSYRVGRYQRLGSALSTREHRDGLAAVEVRR